MVKGTIDNVLAGFTEKIEYVRRISMGVPKIFTIDLGLPLADQIYNISGNIFYIWNAPDAASYVTIKVNSSAEPGINYVSHTGLTTPFDKLLITTPAGQTGNIEIIYGTEAPEMLGIIDNRTAGQAVLEDILRQLRGLIGAERGTYVTMGSNNVGVASVQIINSWDGRVGWTIQAKSTNTGIIFLGINNVVSTALCWRELAASEVMSVNNHTGNVWAISDIAAQGVWHGEW